MTIKLLPVNELTDEERKLIGDLMAECVRDDINGFVMLLLDEDPEQLRKEWLQQDDD